MLIKLKWGSFRHHLHHLQILQPTIWNPVRLIPAINNTGEVHFQWHMSFNLVSLYTSFAIKRGVRSTLNFHFYIKACNIKRLNMLPFLVSWLNPSPPPSWALVFPIKIPILGAQRYNGKWTYYKNGLLASAMKPLRESTFMRLKSHATKLVENSIENIYNIRFCLWGMRCNPALKNLLGNIYNILFWYDFDLIWLFSQLRNNSTGMNSRNMIPQVAAVFKLVFTLIARELIFGMHLHYVPLHVCRLVETFFTVVASEGFFSGVSQHVRLQSSSHWKLFLAHFTREQS